MATALDLFSDALTALGQLGVGQSMSSEQAQQAMRVANRMIGKWSIQRLMLYLVSTRTFNLTAGAQVYTIGPTGATFPGARPAFVESAQATIPGTQTQQQLSILGKPQWDAIGDLGVTCGTNGAPDKVWPEYTYPNLTIHVHPIPSTTTPLSLGTWEILQQFASVFDVVAFPPGYEEAIVNNLAFELAMYYDMAIAPSLAQLAADSLLQIQKINAQTIPGALSETQTLVSPNVGLPPPAPAQG